ncbi:hypothetical protein ACYSN1_21320 [Brucella sp. LJL56]
MVSDFVAWLFALFVIDPLQTSLTERLDQAKLPNVGMMQIQQCVAAHGKKLLAQAEQEPVWAMTTVVGISVGWVSPSQLLTNADPSCRLLFQTLDGDFNGKLES